MDRYYKMDEVDRKIFNAKCAVHNIKRYHNLTEEQYKNI